MFKLWFPRCSGLCEKERRAILSVLCCTWDALPRADVCWAFLEEKKPNKSFLWDSEQRLIDLWHNILCQWDAKEQPKEWPTLILMYNIAFLMQFVFHFDTIHFPSTFGVQRHYSLFEHALGWRYGNCSLVTSTMIKTNTQHLTICKWKCTFQLTWCWQSF